jgi:hypothetical protein
MSASAECRGVASTSASESLLFTLLPHDSNAATSTLSHLSIKQVARFPGVLRCCTRAPRNSSPPLNSRERSSHAGVILSAEKEGTSEDALVGKSSKAVVEEGVRRTSRLRAMRCGRPLAVRTDAATRDIMALRGRVIIGTPAHSTSVALVCALTRGVSMNRSASFARCMYLPDKCSLTRKRSERGRRGRGTSLCASGPKIQHVTQ